MLQSHISSLTEARPGSLVRKADLRFFTHVPCLLKPVSTISTADVGRERENFTRRTREGNLKFAGEFDGVKIDRTLPKSLGREQI